MYLHKLRSLRAVWTFLLAIVYELCRTADGPNKTSCQFPQLLEEVVEIGLKIELKTIIVLSSWAQLTCYDQLKESESRSV